LYSCASLHLCSWFCSRPEQFRGKDTRALKGSAEEKALIQRYTGQLNAQEDRFAALRKEIADLKAQRDQAEQELERMVLEINLDEGS